MSSCATDTYIVHGESQVKQIPTQVSKSLLVLKEMLPNLIFSELKCSALYPVFLSPTLQNTLQSKMGAAFLIVI